MQNYIGLSNLIRVKKCFIPRDFFAVDIVNFAAIFIRRHVEILRTTSRYVLNQMVII